MIEEIIRKLTEAVNRLGDTVDQQNKLLAKQLGVHTNFYALDQEKEVETKTATIELDDRGLPVEQPKKTRTRKKAVEMPLPTESEDAPILGDEGSEVEIVVTSGQLTTGQAIDIGQNGNQFVVDLKATPSVQKPPLVTVDEKGTLIPSSATEPTIQDVRDAFTNYSKKHQDFQSILKLLEVFGAQRLQDLKPHQYSALIDLSKQGKIEKLSEEVINQFKC